jgi:hypothetical protein
MTAILQDEVISIENVAAGVEVKFALMQVLESEVEVRSSKQSKREVHRPLGAAGSLYLSDYTQTLKNGIWIKSSLPLCKN